jgi:hypothetical protein
VTLCNAVLGAVPLYKQAGAPIPDRVADLLQQMTLEEKVAQLVQLWDQGDNYNYVVNNYGTTGLGAVYGMKLLHL